MSLLFDKLLTNRQTHQLKKTNQMNTVNISTSTNITCMKALNNSAKRDNTHSKKGVLSIVVLQSLCAVFTVFALNGAQAAVLTSSETILYDATPSHNLKPKIRSYTTEDYTKAIDFLTKSEDAVQSLLAFKKQYYVAATANTTSDKTNNPNHANSNATDTDSLQIGQHQHQHHHGHNHQHYSFGVAINTPTFEEWLNASSYNQQNVKAYRAYLSQHLGASNVPPMDQLLTTARSWSKCSASQYAVPPKQLWKNMVPTLRLYAKLKQTGTVPYDAKIRSVYRNPKLNACADGAHDSKHKMNAAIDIWVPRYEGSHQKINKMKEDLCSFWLYQGQSHNFGLGLYGTGAIHLDTQGYRKWGKEYSPSYSLCQLDH